MYERLLKRVKELEEELAEMKKGEIDFFKNIKPKFTSKLIYYNAIYKIESKKPHGGERVLKKYLNNELEKLKPSIGYSKKENAQND